MGTAQAVAARTAHGQQHVASIADVFGFEGDSVKVVLETQPLLAIGFVHVDMRMTLWFHKAGMSEPCIA